MSGLYTLDGFINLTTVDGTSHTGLHAADGSWNAVFDDATYEGLYHPCGALRVTTGGDGTSYYAPDGSVYSVMLQGIGSAVSSFLLLSDGSSHLLLSNGTDALLLGH